MRFANILMVTVLLSAYLSLVLFYFIVKSRINKLEQTKNINELDKRTLRYLKKYNFNKEIILGKIVKVIKFNKTFDKFKWLWLFLIILFILHFTLRISDVVIHEFIGGGMFLTGQNAVLFIFCILCVLYVLLFHKLVQKRNIIIYEQFSRLL